MPLLLSAAATATRHLGGASGTPVSFVRIASALIVCLIIAVLAALLVRQRSGALDLASALRRLAPRTGRIEVIETRRLSPHADACLLRHDDREYLLLLQAGTVRVLLERQTEPSELSAPSCD